MIFDSAMLAGITNELTALTGMRLRDLGMAAPRRGESESRAILLAFGNATLLIDAHPLRSRVHLTKTQQLSNTNSTPFIDAARRSLRGATLHSVIQPGFDRALHLRFMARDQLGDARRFVLIAEVMERRSNIVLIDEDGVIVDAQKRLPPFLNRARTVLPNKPYVPPPNDRVDPLEVTDWKGFLGDGFEPGDFDSFIANLRTRVAGVSPVAATYLRRQMESGASAATACARYFGDVQRSRQAKLSPVQCDDQPYPFALHPGCRLAGDSLSALIEAAIDGAAEREQLQHIRSAVVGHIARLEKRLAAQRDDVSKSLSHAADARRHQSQGDLLLANLPLVEAAAARGERWVMLADLYQPGEAPVRIDIEPSWPAADNATRCFNRYKRARKLSAEAPGRLCQLDEEAARLQGWRQRAVAAADAEVLGQLAEEMGLDLAPKKTLSRTKGQQESVRPENKLHRREVEGYTLFMGRSALENQLLLSKLASPSDLWMHVRGMPSAHVLVKAQKGKPVPPKVLEEAGRWTALAGRSSKKMAGELVEIIYTPAKFVRAVKGSPGRVTLQRFETINVRV